MTHLAEHNDDFRYLLTVIDVFCKYAFVAALKKKDSKSVVKAFAKITEKEKRIPLKLQTDNGKELINGQFRAMLEEWDIQFYVSQNENIKASVVERFNRTLKTKIWKYFTHRNTFKFVDVLQDMVHSCNRTHHRTIGRAPIDVNVENATQVYKRMYGDQSRQRPVEPKLGVWQKVRISKTRRTFEYCASICWSGCYREEKFK